MPVAGEAFDGEGSAVGGLVLFLENGRLGSLEIFDLTDGPLPMPTPARVTWSIGDTDD